MSPNKSELRDILRRAKTIAVVGASPKAWRESHSIMRQLLQAGYKVYPVNPNYTEVLGHQCYPDLQAIPEHIDIVDVFRDPAEVLPIAMDAIAVHADVLWLQSGIINEEAAEKASEAGLTLVMDRCIAVDYHSLIQQSS